MINSFVTEESRIYNGGKKKNIQWGKDSFFSKQYKENWTATFERMKQDHNLILNKQKSTQKRLRA